MSRLPYETIGGAFSEDTTLMQVNEKLREAAEACYILGHYKKANGDELRGQGFLGIGQMLEETCKNITALAVGKLTRQ